MYRLINDICDHPGTPDHLRRYLSDHVDTDTEDGLAQFDVLYFIRELGGNLPTAHETLGGDGEPFQRLAESVIGQLQKTPDYQSLQELIRELATKLEGHKDEYGYVDISGLTTEEARHWATKLKQREAEPIWKTQAMLK